MEASECSWERFVPLTGRHVACLARSSARRWGGTPARALVSPAPPSSVSAARAGHAPKKIQRTASPSCGPKRDPLKPSPRTTRSLAALLFVFVSICRRRCRVPKGAGAAVSGGGPRCRRTRRQTGGRPGRTGASLLPPPSHTSTECLLHCPCVLRS